jgi:hypothetical protein
MAPHPHPHPHHIPPPIPRSFYTFVAVVAWLYASILLMLYASKGEAYLRTLTTCISWYAIELSLTVSIGFTAFLCACTSAANFAVYTGAGGAKFGIACAFFGSFGMCFWAYLAWSKMAAHTVVLPPVQMGGAPPQHQQQPQQQQGEHPPVGGHPYILPLDGGAGGDAPPSYNAMAMAAPGGYPPAKPATRPGSYAI